MVKGILKAIIHFEFLQGKCGRVLWFKMVGTNKDDGISSNARNAGSKFLRGDGVRISRRLLIEG